MTEENFQDEVLESDLPVLVEFWATWCGPCKRMAPLLAELADELAGRVTVVTLDVDQNPRTAGRYAVFSVPTFMLVRDGKAAGSLVGAHPRSALAALASPEHVG